MKIVVDLPLQSRHVKMFTPEALESLAADAPGKPVFLNPNGTEPGEKLGVVESAVVVGDRVSAILDVELPAELQSLYDAGDLAYGINAYARKKIRDGEVSVVQFDRLNSVDLVRPLKPVGSPSGP